MGTESSEWEPDELESVPACPVCLSPDRTVLYDGMRDWNFGCASGDWTLKLCATCRSAFVDPRPTPLAIGKAYSQYYTHGASPLPGPQNAVQWLRTGLANDYRRWRYRVARSPRLPGGRLVGRLFPELAIAADVAFGFLPRDKPDGARMLDIGSGAGTLLRNARDAGWEAWGVEPDPVSSARSREQEFAMFPSVDHLFDQPARFHAVTMSHSIEHVHDPRSLVGKAFDLLLPGGHLFIDTPNLGSEGHRRLGKHWPHLDSPRHLVIFNRKSLGDLLSQQGFGEIVFHARRDVGITDRFMQSSDPIESAPVSRADFGPAAYDAVFADGPRDKREYLTVTARKP